MDVLLFLRMPSRRGAHLFQRDEYLVKIVASFLATTNKPEFLKEY